LGSTEDSTYLDSTHPSLDRTQAVTEPVLSDLRVIEFSDGLSSAFCGKLLAERGAEVIKVEPPSGDPSRRMGPFPGDPDPECSALFLHMNTSKKSVTLDMSTEEGRCALRRLIVGADVFVEGTPPGHLQSLGFSYDDIAMQNPCLVYVSITPYGQTGPYRDYKGNALTAIATSGVMSVTGWPDREPLSTGVDLANYFAGIQAWLAVLAAVMYRDRYGLGQYIDVAVMESMATADESTQAAYGFMGVIRRRFYSRHLWGYPQDPMPCKDGHVFFHPGPQGFPSPLKEGFEGGISGLALLLGDPDLDANPLFTTRWERWFRWQELNDILAPFLATQTADDIVPIAQALRMPFAPFLNVAQLLENEHLAEREFFREVEHPVAGKLRHTGGSFRMSISPARIERAPLLGEHEALLEEPPRKPPVTAKPERETVLPLKGVRVLDLSQVWAGPTCTAVLAALGADVIKIEGLSRQDVAHTLLVNDNHPVEPWNCGPYFQIHNSDKRSLALDLLQEDGLDLFKRLVAACDVLVEAFSPRVMRNFALTYDSLRRIRPDLIMVSMSGFGQNGPYCDYAAYGMGLESVCGIGSLTGYLDGTIVRTSVSHTDPFSGFAAAGAVMLALRHRERMGEGQYIDLSEHELGVTEVGTEILGYQMNGRVPGPRGNRREGLVQGCYRCAGNDDWIVLTIGDDDEWCAISRVTGHPEWLEDERFRTQALRCVNHDLLDGMIEEWTSQQPQIEAFHRLQEAGVTAAPVLDGKQMLLDPHFRARGHCDLLDHGRFGPRFVPRHLTPHFSRIDTHPKRCAPSLGEHNREILRELGGLSDEEIAGLEKRKVIGDIPILLLSGDELAAYLVETMTYPLDRMVEQGALRAVEPDYLEQLGLA
jgi:crotonobetainyl-CoA:carnitine CoA-transferase CaiB-like acyl-CoA transferase